MNESHNIADRALIACSLWLHVGFIGAAALGAASMRLLDGETTLLRPLTVAVSGGVLAAMSWRRARNTLERAGPTAQSRRIYVPWSPADAAVVAGMAPERGADVAGVPQFSQQRQPNHRPDDERRHSTPA